MTISARAAQFAISGEVMAKPASGPLTKRCPKCNGYLYRGGVRFGMAAGDIVSCANCGLINESSRFLDAAGEYRDIDAVTVRTRKHRIGGRG